MCLNTCFCKSSNQFILFPTDDFINFVVPCPIVNLEGKWETRVGKKEKSEFLVEVKISLNYLFWISFTCFYITRKMFPPRNKANWRRRKKMESADALEKLKSEVQHIVSNGLNHFGHNRKNSEWYHRRPAFASFFLFLFSSRFQLFAQCHPSRFPPLSL